MRGGGWLYYLFLLADVAAIEFACIGSNCMSSKVAAELQEAFTHSDHVNIMVELIRSTTEVDAVPGDRTQYVQNLQAFSAAQQQPVRDLLELHPNEYIGEPNFFWIDSKVHIPQATAVLVMELASLDAVKHIRGEVTARIQPMRSLAVHDDAL
ncbi:unnamed protein product [Aphanomyces euteiches]